MIIPNISLVLTVNVIGFFIQEEINHLFSFPIFFFKIATLMFPYLNIVILSYYINYTLSIFSI